MELWGTCGHRTVWPVWGMYGSPHLGCGCTVGTLRVPLWAPLWAPLCLMWAAHSADVPDMCCRAHPTVGWMGLPTVTPPGPQGGIFGMSFTLVMELLILRIQQNGET